jgi:hypothetical protein
MAVYRLDRLGLDAVDLVYRSQMIKQQEDPCINDDQAVPGLKVSKPTNSQCIVELRCPIQ